MSLLSLQVTCVTRFSLYYGYKLSSDDVSVNRQQFRSWICSASQRGFIKDSALWERLASHVGDLVLTIDLRKHLYIVENLVIMKFDGDLKTWHGFRIILQFLRYLGCWVKLHPTKHILCSISLLTIPSFFATDSYTKIYTHSGILWRIWSIC